MQLSVVIPARNEAGSLESLIGEIRRQLSGRLAYEIIVVDDGSQDGTLDCLRRLKSGGRNDLRIRRLPESRGQSAAILDGVKAARAPLVATLDADGQNDPADLPQLVAYFTRAGRPPNLQLVSGLRRKRQDNWIRRLSSRAANGVRRWLLRDRAADTGCGLKVFSREAFLALPQFDHMHRFLPALILRQGGEVEFCEVNHRARSAGRSNYGIRNRLWVGIVDLIGVMWLQRRRLLTAGVEE